jgi:hypothetical protein
MHKKVMAGWRQPIELAVNDVVEHFFRQHRPQADIRAHIHNYVIPYSISALR